MLSAIAAMLYLVVAALCGWAALRVDPARGLRSQMRGVWAALAILFVSLAASRLTGLEEIVRALLRSWLVAEGQYENRRAVQGPIAALVIALAGAAGIALLLRWGRIRSDREWRMTMWAARAGAAMIALVVLRLVSFHPTDVLLYAVRLNWVLDIGLTLIAAACALAFGRRRAQARAR